MNSGEEPNSFAADSLMSTPIIASPSSVATPTHAQGPVTRGKKPVPLYAMKTAKKRRKERQAWTGSEDAALKRLIQCHDFDDPNTKNHWQIIANKLKGGRNGKQCRDRFQNHLRPDIKKGQWTKEEETMIRELHKSFGTKWSCMAKLMNNRTDNDIKNKWYSMMRKEQNAQQKQAKRQQKTQRASFAVDMPDALSDNETIDENMMYDELSQLATGPGASDAFFLAAYTQGAQGWSFSNLSGQDYSAFYNPQFVAEGQGSFAMLSAAAASQPMIVCNGTTANVVMESDPMTMEMRGAEPSRSANLGVPNPSLTMGLGMAMQQPRGADRLLVDRNVGSGLMANRNMPTATEVGCTLSKIGVNRSAAI